MSRSFHTGINRQERAQIGVEKAAREQVAYNAIIKAEAFMIAHGHSETAKKWITQELELGTAEGDDK